MKPISFLFTIFLTVSVVHAQDVSTPAAPTPSVMSEPAQALPPSVGASSPTVPGATLPNPTVPNQAEPEPAIGDATAQVASAAATSDGALQTGVNAPETQEAPASTESQDPVTRAIDAAKTFLIDGGPSIWAIAALSVMTFALILWKIWRLALIGAWSKGKARRAVAAYEAGVPTEALTLVERRRGVRSKVVAAALRAIKTMPTEHAREETARVAKNELASARAGLGALELISTIAPLLGLLGTVMGMISAFQALQAAGSKADPSMLAGGIWEALLTTAAGMAVAIPASAALTWFEAVIDRIRRDLEDGTTRIFVSTASAKARGPQDISVAAE